MKNYLLLSTVILAIASPILASAEDLTGPVRCSNARYENAPYTPDEVLLVPYVDYLGAEKWLFTIGRDNTPLFGSDSFTFDSPEVFNIDKMRSTSSTASCEEWEDGLYACRLPEFDYSVVTYFDCEKYASRDALKKSYGSTPSLELEAIDALLKKIEDDYGPDLNRR